MNKQIIKGAIVSKYGSQCVAAKKLGIPESRLSRLINGHDVMKPSEAKTFQQKLGVSFGEESRG